MKEDVNAQLISEIVGMLPKKYTTITDERSMLIYDIGTRKYIVKPLINKNLDKKRIKKLSIIVNGLMRILGQRLVVLPNLLTVNITIADKKALIDVFDYKDKGLLRVEFVFKPKTQKKLRMVAISPMVIPFIMNALIEKLERMEKVMN